MKKKHKRKKDAKNKKISDLLCQNSALKMKNRILEEIFRRQRYEGQPVQLAISSVPDTNVGEWKKYPEEKPEENDWYLTTNGEGLPKITYFDIDIWYQTGKFYEVEVTHWQPLPELPKEE